MSEALVPPVEFSDKLYVLNLIAYIRKQRAELEPFAAPPSTDGAKRLNSRQQGALFDLLRAIDDLFPGVQVKFPEGSA